MDRGAGWRLPCWPSWGMFSSMSSILIFFFELCVARVRACVCVSPRRVEGRGEEGRGDGERKSDKRSCVSQHVRASLAWNGAALSPTPQDWDRVEAGVARLGQAPSFFALCVPHSCERSLDTWVGNSGLPSQWNGVPLRNVEGEGARKWPSAPPVAASF